MPSNLFAKNPLIVAPELSVKFGHTFTVHIDNVPPDTKVEWRWDPLLDCTKTDNISISCRADHLLGKEVVEAVVTAKIPSLAWQSSVTVTIDEHGGRRPKPWKQQIPPDPKVQRVAELLENYKAKGDAINFFRTMGAESLNMKDLFAFKKAIIEKITKEQGFEEANRFWNENYRTTEIKLMAWRRQEVINLWNDVVKQFLQQNPDIKVLIRMDIGLWGQHPDARLKFESDIDFTIVMLRPEQANALRDLFNSEMRHRFGIDPVSLDVIATAHRNATLSAYIGDYSADWAERDAARRGELHAYQISDGELTEITPTKSFVKVTLALLKNNIAIRDGHPDMLAKILEDTMGEKPTYDSEPGLSLEFLRHLNENVRTKYVFFEKLIKIAKEVARSAREHTLIMTNVYGASPSQSDTELVRISQEIIALKDNKSLTVEEVIIRAAELGDTLMGKNWTDNPDDSLKNLGERAIEYIKKNIETSLDARIKHIDAMKIREDQESEKRKLLNDLENEFNAFKRENINFPDKALAVMRELASYFEARKFRLPENEQKKLKQILEMVQDNPDSLKTWVSLVWVRATQIYNKTDQAIDAMNNFLDTLDNHTIEKIRQLGGEIEIVKDGKKTILKNPIKVKAVNDWLNSTPLGTVGNSPVYKGINLIMEGKAYLDAIVNAETWTDAFKNLGYELMVRRLPGYALTEVLTGLHYEAGIKQFGRVALEIAYLFFPLAAVPEGIYGMVQGVAEWSVGKMQEWRYEDMVNELYRGAKFDGSGNTWKIVSLTYKCPSGGDLTLHGRDEILKLPMKCGSVYQTIIPQIKNHPLLIQLQEMLDNPAVSSGRMGNFPFNWDVKGGKYGAQLLKIYRKKVDDVALEFFKGVVEQLEKAHAWASGKKLVEVMQIERELGCTETLIKFNIGYFGSDRYLDDVKRLQRLVENFNQIKRANESILAVKDKWNANDPATETRKGFKKTFDNKFEEVDYTWVKGLFPECSESSIEKKSKEAQKMDGQIKDAVKKCQIDAEKIVGSDNVNDTLLTPLVKPAICVAVYKDTNRFIADGCQKDYEKALEEIKRQAVDIKINAIVGPDTVCAGYPVTFKVQYDRICDTCIAEWLLVETNEYLPDAIKDQITWIPRYDGKNTIRVSVKPDKDSKKIVEKEKIVKVLPADKCPKLTMRFKHKGDTIKNNALTLQPNEIVEIMAELEGSLPPGQHLVEYAWAEDGRRKTEFTANTYQFSAKNKKGKTVVITVKARTNVGTYTEEARLTIKVSDSSEDKLSVFIKPSGIKTISGQDPITLTADYIRKANSGRMRIHWNVTVTEKERKSSYTLPPINDVASINLDPTKFKEGDVVTVSLFIADIDNTFESPTYGQILREGSATISMTVVPSGDLKVRLSSVPYEISVAEGFSVCVTEPSLKPDEPQNKYRFSWKFGIDGRYSDNEIHAGYEIARCVKNLSVAGLTGKTVALKVNLTDNFGRSQEAETPWVKVVEDTYRLQISVKPQNISITNDQTITFVVNVIPLKDSGRLTINGTTLPEGITQVSIPVSFEKEENWVTVPFTVVDEKGRMADTHATVFVKKKQPDACTYQYSAWSKCDPKTKKQTRRVIDKEPKGCVESEKPIIEQACTPTERDAPTCSYEYSAWSECSRATKKQTRTVISKKPAGCIERQKPVLEQACTPPLKPFSQLTKDEKNNLFGCLCQCSCGGPACRYVPPCDKDPGGVLACPCVGMPPCQWGEWGCNYTYFKTTGECIENCFKNHYVVYSAVQSERDIRAENRKHMKPLKVRLSPDAKPIRLQYGDVVTLKAEVQGGMPGYTYNWSGDGMGKDGEFTFAKGRKPGSYPISITVNDSDGNTATASTTIVVEAITVKLEKLSPSGNTVTVGGKGTFKATVMAGKDIAKGDFVIRWEPYKYKVAEFKERETKGATGQNEVKFMAPGRHLIYVDVLQNIEGRLQTVGESEQITIEVKNPQWEMSFEPVQPKVGQMVKAVVKATGVSAEEMKGMDFQWLFPDNAKQTGAEQRDGVASFYLKDTKPANIQCVVRLDGENLGGVGKTITAQSYQVSIGEPRYRESPPQIWQCDTQLGQAQRCGMVTLKANQFAVHQDILVKATVTPTPDSPRYRWTIDPAGSCGFPGAGDEIKINCSNVGTYTIRLEVTNADGVKLGEATQTVSITITQEQVNNSKKSKDAYEKVQKAKELISQGKIDEAISLVTEAVNLDPKNQEAKNLSDKWKRERDSINKNIENINRFIIEKKFQEAEKELSQAKALHPKYAKVLEAEKRLNEEKKKYQKEVTDRINEAKRLLSDKKIDEAVSVIKEVSKIDKSSAQPVMNQIAQQAKNMGWDALNKGDYKSAIKRLEQAVELNPADSDAQKKLKEARDYQAKMPMIETKMKEFEQLVTNKKIVSSHQKMMEIQDILRTMAAGQSSSNPVVIKLNEEYNKLNKWYNDLTKKTDEEWGRYFQSQDWEPAEKLLTEVLKYEHTEPNKRHFENALQTVRLNLNQKREAVQYYEQAKANNTKGQPSDVKGIDEVIRELNIRLNRFKQTEVMYQNIKALVSDLEKRKRAINAIAYAMNFFNSGDEYYKTYQYANAVKQYEEGLRAIKDNADIRHPLYERYYRLWEDAVAKDKRFREIYQYVSGLAETTQPLDEQTLNKGLVMGEEGLKIVPNSGDLQRHINKIKWKIGELKLQKQLQSQCEAKWTEGTALYNAKRYNEALVKFKENLTCAPNNQERRNYVAQLEQSLKQQEAQRQACMNIRKQGDSLAQQKRLKEAIVQYREHLRCNPDRQLEDYIRQLEEIVNKDEEQRQRYEYARRLRAEGEQLQKANRIQEAIGKYRESLRYLPDSELEKHIRELELAMARPTPTPSPTYSPPVVTTPQTMNLTGSWVGRCEGMSSEYSIEVRHSGNTFTAKSEYDEYSGTIKGNQIRGKSKTGDDIMGSISNSNQMKITIAYKNITYKPLKCDLYRKDSFQPSKHDTGQIEHQRQPYYQVDFRTQFTHNRKEGPWSYEGVPLLGYQGMPAPIVWLTRCKAPNGDGICYPMKFEWRVDNYTATSLYLLTNLSWWGNNLQNKVIARLTVSGVGGQTQIFDIRAGIHTAEWNGGEIKDNPPLVKIVHPQNINYAKRRFLNKFGLGRITVTKITIELLDIPSNELNGVMEVSAITLAK